MATSTVSCDAMLVGMRSGRRRECALIARAEEEGFFGGGPVARWRVEGRSVRWLGRLRRAGEVVPRGGDVGSEVLGEVCVGLEGGQRGFQILVCICIWVFQRKSKEIGGKFTLACSGCKV